MDLTEFLTARLDEDEAAAKLNIGTGPGWANGLGDTEDGAPSWPDYQMADVSDLREATDYVYRFRPLRALREAEAGRKLLAWYAATGDRAYLNAIRAMAAVYSDHPDYDPLWAPPE